MEKTYNHIWYQDCPHFYIGRADQWGERGYLLFENEVYEYMVDRKEQYDIVKRPKSVADFLAYAQVENITVPDKFLKELNK